MSENFFNVSKRRKLDRRRLNFPTIDEVAEFYRELQHTDVVAECSYLNEHDGVEINNQSSYYRLFMNVMFNEDGCFSNLL